jgi:chromosome segregation ATPase
MDSEAFANLIKPARTVALPPRASTVPAKPPAKEDRNIFKSLKRLEDQVSPLKQSLQSLQKSQDKAISALHTVVFNIQDDIKAMQKARSRDSTDLQKFIDEMHTKLTSIQSQSVKATQAVQEVVDAVEGVQPEAVPTISSTSEKALETTLADRVSSLERKIVLLADQLQRVQDKPTELQAEEDAIAVQAGGALELSPTSSECDLISSDDSMDLSHLLGSQDSRPTKHYSLRKG